VYDCAEVILVALVEASPPLLWGYRRGRGSGCGRDQHSRTRSHQRCIPL